MKIGLLTYHKSYNCGAVLQTYATCRLLKELGHEVELIDLRQPEPIKLRQLIIEEREDVNMWNNFRTVLEG